MNFKKKSARQWTVSGTWRRSRVVVWTAPVLAVCLAFLLPAASVFSQGRINQNTTESEAHLGQQSLNAVFKDYDLLDIDLNETVRTVESKGQLGLRVKGSDYELRLEPIDLLAAGYRATVVTDFGTIEQPPSSVTTYRGRVEGDASSDVRLLIQDDMMFGYVRTERDWIFIDPLDKYEAGARPGQLIAYRDADVRAGFRDKCGTTGLTRQGSKLLEGGQSKEGGSSEGPSWGGEIALAAKPDTLRIVELATEADFAYFQQNNSSANRTFDVIKGLINQVDGFYRAEVGLMFVINFQRAWATINDPYFRTDAAGLLNQFQSFWNNNETSIPRDVAHLFTGMNIVDASGIARISSACDRDEAYSLSAVPGFKVVVHELGHNLGATHDDEFNPPTAGCGGGTGPTMCSDGGGDLIYFSPRSRDDIIDHVDDHRSCLSAASAGEGEFYTTSGLGGVTKLGPTHNTWRNNWYLIIPGNFGGTSRTDLLFYDRARGEGTFFVTDGNGNISQLGIVHTTWRRTWDIIVPGDFDGDSRTDLLFYDRAAGVGVFYKTDGNGGISQLGPVHNWRTTWTQIIPGNFGGNGRTDLFFYDAPEGVRFGQYEFYTSDGNGNVAQLGTTKNTRQLWDIIVPGQFGDDAHTDLLTYKRASGNGAFFTTDGTSNLWTLGPAHGNWRTSWSLIIPGNFDTNHGTDLLFYDRAAGHGEFYSSSGTGNIGMLGTTHGWRNSWDLIIPGDFGGTSNFLTDVLFYEH